MHRKKERKKKKGQKLAEARLAETPVESAVLQTGPCKVTPTWGSSGECNEGWGSTVLGAPSSGTQARKDGHPPMAQSRKQASGGRGELGDVGRIKQIAPGGHTQILFLSLSGIYTEHWVSCVEKVASHEAFLIFWVPNLSFWKLSSEIPGSIYNTCMAFFTAASKHHNSLPLEKKRPHNADRMHKQTHSVAYRWIKAGLEVMASTSTAELSSLVNKPVNYTLKTVLWLNKEQPKLAAILVLNSSAS